jgi:Na+:H+ antiporter, NhaC family
MNKKPVSLGYSLIPLAMLVLLMIVNVIVFKDNATGGPNQLALVISACLAVFIGKVKLQIPYKIMETGIINSIMAAMNSCLILLVIGSVVSCWIIAGIVPTLIWIGFKIISPALFLPIACLSCAIISLSTGSSWTTTGTIGIALMAIGKAYGFPDGMIAGAVISGAYFGDKMSPLSDTTNLAPAMAGTDLFTHIRHMLYTSVPAIILALIGFSILNFTHGGSAPSMNQIQEISMALEESFTISIWLLIVPLAVFFLVMKKVPALPTLILSILFGLIAAIIFQQDLLLKMSDEANLMGMYGTLIGTLGEGVSIKTSNAVINDLLNRGGMSSMLSTVWLILCAMVFGGALEVTGMLHRMADSILSLVKGTGSLIGATLASAVFTNATACDQYIAIVLPGRMFKNAYDKFGLHPKNLSRAVEDAGTVTSVLIPWNSGGAYNSGILGVPTLTYLPYCFFNLASPLISAFLGAMNLTIEKKLEESK